MMGAGLILQRAVKGVVGHHSISVRPLPGLVHVVGDLEGGESPVPDAHLVDFAGEAQVFILDPLYRIWETASADDELFCGLDAISAVGGHFYPVAVQTGFTIAVGECNVDPLVLIDNGTPFKRVRGSVFLDEVCPKFSSFFQI